MRRWLWNYIILIFLCIGIALPCSAATWTINNWTSGAQYTNLYENDYTTGDTLNIRSNITDTTANIGTYLGGAKTLTFDGTGGYYISGNSAYYGFEVASGGNYIFNSLTIRNFTSSGNGGL